MLNRAQREQIRKKFGGRCAYCGRMLPYKGWHVDHVKAIKRVTYMAWNGIERPCGVKAGAQRPENECGENLFPACAPCNMDKRANSLEKWRKLIIARLRVSFPQWETSRRNAILCAERFGISPRARKPPVFWFEEYKTMKAKGYPWHEITPRKRPASQGQK